MNNFIQNYRKILKKNTTNRTQNDLSRSITSPQAFRHNHFHSVDNGNRYYKKSQIPSLLLPIRSKL